jgi:hypothetical protein
MPQYKKAFDIGTYTGTYTWNRIGDPTLRIPGPSGKQVTKSLRFRSEASNYLSRTLSVSGNTKKWTYSFWFKRAGIVTNTYGNFFGTSSSGGYTYFRYGYPDYYSVDFGFGPGQSGYRYLNRKFSDASQWYHMVVIWDTAQTNWWDRNKFYINGSLISWYPSSVSAGYYPGLNEDSYWNATGRTQYIGYGPGASGTPFDGYMSETIFSDGYAYDPTNFGEYNTDGIWVPKTFSGSYGTNGFYLPMNSSSNYATDQSGNSNNWTPNGFNVTTANTSYDLLNDTPTDVSGTDTGAGGEVSGNYAINNPLLYHSGYAANASSTEGGLYSACGSTYEINSSLPIPKTGKWYAEFNVLVSGINGSFFGFQTRNGSNNVFLWNYYGKLYIDGADAGAYFQSSVGDYVGVAVDCDNGTYQFYRNGVGQGQKSYSTLIGNGTFHFSAQSGSSSYPTTYRVNFGQRAFAYAAPSGYKTLCTSNFPRSTSSSLWFYNDTPDFMWIKNRSTTTDHSLTDTVRGTEAASYSNLTSIEGTATGPGDLAEFNKFGFTVIGASSRVSGSNSNNFVYWAWKAGGATVTNTSGTITSQVSANPSTGFSIVTWTGTGASSATVGHGLSTLPNLVLIKKRNVVENWYVAHSGSGQGINYAYHLFLNTTGSLSGSNDPYYMGSQISSTSNLLALADGTSNNGGNQSGTNYVAYCWTAIPGYSAFGSYVGSGGSDGPTVYTGFRPRWIMWKRTDTLSSWFMYDAVRSTYNVMGLEMYADSTSGEGATTRMDFLSNGIKLRAANSGDNASSGTYIYAAFAEAPFKYARAR